MKTKYPLQVYDRRSKSYITKNVEIEIDITLIATTLGRKAWESKAGKSTALHGAVKVKVEK